MRSGQFAEFDLDLCAYVVGNIRSLLLGVEERPAPQPKIHPAAWDRLDFPNWFAHQLTGDMAALADYVWAGVWGDTPRLPLNDAELFALVTAVDNPPMRLDPICLWQPYPALHGRYVECIPEIRASLARETAEEWAAASVAFGARLCAGPLTLADGIGIVHEWLWDSRRLLGVLGAADSLPCPLGTRPTPTCRRPAVQSARTAPPATPGGRGAPEKAGPREPRHGAVCGWREAMEITGLKKTKLYELFNRGVLKGYRDGTMIRFYRTGLAAYMRARENDAAAPARAPRRAGKRPPTGPGPRFKFL